MNNSATLTDASLNGISQDLIVNPDILKLIGSIANKAQYNYPHTWGRQQNLNLQNLNTDTELQQQ